MTDNVSLCAHRGARRRKPQRADDHMYVLLLLFFLSFFVGQGEDRELLREKASFICAGRVSRGRAKQLTARLTLGCARTWRPECACCRSSACKWLQPHGVLHFTCREWMTMPQNTTTAKNRLAELHAALFPPLQHTRRAEEILTGTAARV